MNQVYDIITERVIALLEKGVAPWNKPWAGGAGGFPRNLSSGKHYRGINIWMLHAAGFSSPWWLSFNQVKERGGNVRKGEKASMIVFYKQLPGKEENGEKGKSIPFLRYSNVFNSEQCEGIEVPQPAPTGTERVHTPIEEAERIVSAMPKRPQLEHTGSRACYSPSQDRVRMPEARHFTSPESYYNTLFHELVHSTGHATRVGREFGKGYGTTQYCKEELVAEMGAAFLCGHASIVDTTLDNSAAYLKHWIDVLKEDHKLIISAASQAQKASDWILDRKPEDPTVTPEATEAAPQPATQPEPATTSAATA